MGKADPHHRDWAKEFGKFADTSHTRFRASSLLVVPVGYGQSLVLVVAHELGMVGRIFDAG